MRGIKVELASVKFPKSIGDGVTLLPEKALQQFRSMIPEGFKMNTTDTSIHEFYDASDP